MYAFSSGLGFGFISGLITYVTPLSLSSGPGTLFYASCGNVSAFYLFAINTLLSQLLHVVWMMIAVEGYSKKDRLQISWVIVGHLVCSYASLLNSASLPLGCAGAIIIPLVYLMASVRMTYNILLGIRKENTE
jgi:anterior pharynx defective protein 1